MRRSGTRETPRMIQRGCPRTPDTLRHWRKYRYAREQREPFFERLAKFNSFVDDVKEVRRRFREGDPVMHSEADRMLLAEDRSRDLS